MVHGVNDNDSQEVIVDTHRVLTDRATLTLSCMFTAYVVSIRTYEDWSLFGTDRHTGHSTILFNSDTKSYIFELNPSSAMVLCELCSENTLYLSINS